MQVKAGRPANCLQAPTSRSPIEAAASGGDLGRHPLGIALQPGLVPRSWSCWQHGRVPRLPLSLRQASLLRLSWSSWLPWRVPLAPSLAWPRPASWSWLGLRSARPVLPLPAFSPWPRLAARCGGLRRLGLYRRGRLPAPWCSDLPAARAGVLLVAFANSSSHGGCGCRLVLTLSAPGIDSQGLRIHSPRTCDRPAQSIARRPPQASHAQVSCSPQDAVIARAKYWLPVRQSRRGVPKP